MEETPNSIEEVGRDETDGEGSREEYSRDSSAGKMKFLNTNENPYNNVES